ncbi:MAG: DNA integrity scanning protein DisA nucleotide-binding domain protein [Actinomycetota bacterium]
MSPNEDTNSKRRTRLVQELSDESVTIVRDHELLSGGFTNHFDLEDLVIDELLYSRYAPVHEGRTRSYGVLIASSMEWLREKMETASFEPVLVEVTDPASSLSSIRQLADGTALFVLRTPNGGEALLRVPAMTELRLVEFLQEVRCQAVQRHPSGSIKLFGDDQIFTFDNNEWSVKQVASSRTLELLHYFNLAVSEHFDVARSILDFCVHSLSANHVGATLVWDVSENVIGKEGSLLARPGREVPVPIDIRNELHQEALANLLATLDGATILDKVGEIQRVETHLSTSETAVRLIDAETGTRHTSAKRFSFDAPGTIVFVVSQDGPVSLFSDGVAAFHLRAMGTYAASLQNMVPDKAADIEGSADVKTCPKCGKRLAIEITYITGWTERESVDCPVCGEADVYKASCFGLRAAPLKPWDTESRLLTWGL